VFAVPAEINENDADGYENIAEMTGGYHIPLEDKYLLE